MLAVRGTPQAPRPGPWHPVTLSNGENLQSCAS